MSANPTAWWGRQTKEAIADFEGKIGMKRDGRAGLKVLNALRGG